MDGLLAGSLPEVNDESLIKSLIHRPPKAQHVSIIVGDLESPQTICCVRKLPMYRNIFAKKFCVECVRIAGEDVSVPPGPFVARTVRLGMDMGCDALKANHDLIAARECPEVIDLFFAATFMQDLKPKTRFIEINRRL